MKAGLLPSQAHFMAVKFHWFKEGQEFRVLLGSFTLKQVLIHPWNKTPQECTSIYIYLTDFK